MIEENKSKYFKLFMILSFLLPLVIYLLTVCPTTYAADTGEFITGAYTMGVIHPPGYPIYCILGKLFTFIPFGNVAMNVNFMSGFWAALTGLFLFLLIYRLTKKIEIAFVSAMLFCFSFKLWSLSVIAEVYTLNIFFLSVCLYVLQLWRETDKNKYLYILSFIYGLSLCNHHAMLLAGPLFIIFIIWTRWQVLKDLKLILGCIGLFILGLLPYLYLPIASKFNPVLDWGNPETLGRFLAHVQRKTYAFVGVENLIKMSGKLEFFKMFLTELKQQFGIPLIVIGILGFINMCRKDIKFWAFALGIFIFNSAFFIFIQELSYNISIINIMSVFYLPCYLIFACYIAYGLTLLWDLIVKSTKNNSFTVYALKIIVLLLILMPLIWNFHKNDLHKNYYVHDFVKSTMDMMDEDAVIFAAGDGIVFNILYFQEVKKYRTDIKMYDDSGYVAGGFLGDDFMFGSISEDWAQRRRQEVFGRIIDENYSKYPIYFNYSFNLGKDSKYRLQPYGLLLRVVKKGEKIDPETIPVSRIHIRNLDDDSIYKDYYVRELLSFYWNVMGMYYESVSDMKKAGYCYLQACKYGDIKFLERAGKFFAKTGNFDMALDVFGKILSEEPENHMIYYYTARTYELKGDKPEALKNYIIFCNKYKGEINYINSARDRINKLNAK
ncbi:MAG: DUF2723 domain-containing protein [Armatimonadota bacterium]